VVHRFVGKVSGSGAKTQASGVQFIERMIAETTRGRPKAAS
jgi:hypothetical protein